MVKVSDLFDVHYGHSLELNGLKRAATGEGVAFVSRQMGENGISAWVEPMPEMSPAPAGELSCALGGNGVLTTHLQEQPYYTGRDVARLVPRVLMTKPQILFYCMCIKANRFRYNYGRQANRTLKNLEIPSIGNLPPWIEGAADLVLEGFSKRLEDLSKISEGEAPVISQKHHRLIPLEDIFEVRYGHSLELNRLKQLDRKDGGISFVSRKMGDNGVAAFVKPILGLEPAPPGDLSCALSGNGVLSTFVQDDPFYTAFHVACLRPKVNLSHEQLFYYCACIKANKYRYSYGRQANRTLRELLLPAPPFIPAWVVGGMAKTVMMLSKPLDQIRISRTAVDTVA